MAKVLGFSIRYFSNYYTLHRSDLAARAVPLDPRLIYYDTFIHQKQTNYISTNTSYLYQRSLSNNIHSYVHTHTHTHIINTTAVKTKEKSINKYNTHIHIKTSNKKGREK